MKNLNVALFERVSKNILLYLKISGEKNLQK